MKKFLALLLVLFLTLNLFAQGAKEINDSQTVVKVVKLIEFDETTYSLSAINQKGKNINYIIDENTKTSFPIENIKKGDVLVLDNQEAYIKNIRYITYAAALYDIDFPQVAESEYTLWEVRLDDDMISKFNYAYGYLSIDNFKNQGLILKGGYFAKGILDSTNKVEPLIKVEEMDPIIEEYISEIYSKGIIHDNGAKYSSLAEIDGINNVEALEDKFSYSYGYMVAASLTYNGIDLLAAPFIEGALTSVYSLDPIMDDAALDSAIKEYSDYLNSQYEQMIAELMAENKKKADAFLLDNSTKEGVTVLPSGVQYYMINEGDGATPTETDTIIANYVLRNIDGNILDQGTEVKFSLTSLIPGFVSAVTNMKVGGAITAYIPPELGYGETGTDTVEPNSLLIFDIELIEIVK